MLSCRKASELASRSLDRPLTAGERITLTLHLAICGICRRYRRQIMFISRAAREMSRPGMDARAPETGLSETARQRCRRAIEEAKKRKD
jgi:hypothetical protein